MTAIQAGDVAVRDVTHEEVEHFGEHGWAHLPGLLDPTLAAHLLERTRGRMGTAGDAHEQRVGVEYVVPVPNAWQYRYMSRDDELFAAVTGSERIGRNAARLLGRNGPIRRMDDVILVKQPVSVAPDYGGEGGFHQDPIPFDQFGLGFWIALDEITPEHGPLVFYDGSHKLGPLGRLRTPGLLESWERLGRCPLTKPLHLQPGDATAHANLMVHNGLANRASSPRWAYAVWYFPGDANYTGGTGQLTDGLGLVPHEPVDHPDFPLVYDPR